MVVFVAAAVGGYRVGKYAYRKAKAVRKCKNKKGKAKKLCIVRALHK